jgi:preprotein translocase subunit SecE
MKKIISFLMESYGELRKVNWPSRDDVVAQTIVVVFSLIFVSLALFGIDLVFFQLIQKIITLGK